MLTDLDHNSELNGADSSQTSRTTPIPNAVPSRERSDTLSSTVSSIPGPQGQPRMTSMYFVLQALESIQNSKEGKRKGSLKDAIGKALGMS